MTPTQKKRFTVVFLILAGVALATFFALQAFKQNAEFFRTPSQLVNGEIDPLQRYRVAGLVKKQSTKTLEDGITHQFVITDCEFDVLVQYTGILPDLFRESQAIVATGQLNQERLLIANQVLAKHDENYVPKEAAEAVMKAQASKCEQSDGPVDY